MVKYYFINVALMVVNTILLVFIKFLKYNRGVISATGEVPRMYFFLVFATIIITIIAYIKEIIQLNRTHNITVAYVLINIILVIIPFMAYMFF